MDCAQTSRQNSRRSSGRYLLWTLLALMIGLGGSFVSGGDGPTRGNTSKSGATSSDQEIVLSGCFIKYMDDGRSVIAAERLGTVSKVSVREGDDVEEGQLLMALKDDYVRAQLASAESQATNDAKVRQAKTANDTAKEKFNYAREASESKPGAVSKAELAQLRLEVNKTAIEIDIAQHELEVFRLKRDEVKAELASFSVKAPFTGRVIRSFKARGEGVQQGDAVFELVNSRKLRVEGYLNPKDWTRVQRGSKVRVALDRETIGQAKEAPGKVVFVDIAVEPVRNEVRVWAEVDNADGLLHVGTTARMTIEP